MSNGNDAHLSIEQSVTPLRESLVCRVRIEVHNMRTDEDYDRPGKSENHVTFALLLGNGQSVRFDMSHTSTMLGKLSIRGRSTTLSRMVMKWTDINASCCPDQFNEAQAPMATRGAQRFTVNDYMQHIIARSLHRYRFMYVDSSELGCRHWV